MTYLLIKLCRSVRKAAFVSTILCPWIFSPANDAQASFATSEEEIVVNTKLCNAPQSRVIPQIRSDFTICSQPSNALSGSCIPGSLNEPDTCGFGSNLQGLCGYCASSSPNSTDSCCINSQASAHCSNVHLPTTTSLPPLFPSSTSTSQPATTDASSSQRNHLTGGDIAGIVVGSVLGLALIGALTAVILICIRRRRRQENASNVLNQPGPHRKGPASQMQYATTSGSQTYAAAPPVGRVARMSALQGESADSPPRTNTGTTRGGAAKYSDTSDSEGFGPSPDGRRRGPPTAGRRQGSLSSTSVLGMESETSPQSRSGGDQVSSPEAVTSGQSEQLASFRDYYSQDDIHPNDRVAVLWAYQPRAGDEFDLERGDVLKVVGIWDDGWATGVRLNERAEDFDLHNQQRDSGVSNGSDRRAPSPVLSGEIKAFPVCCPTLLIFKRRFPPFLN